MTTDTLLKQVDYYLISPVQINAYALFFKDAKPSMRFVKSILAFQNPEKMGPLQPAMMNQRACKVNGAQLYMQLCYRMKDDGYSTHVLMT